MYSLLFAQKNGTQEYNNNNSQHFYVRTYISVFGMYNLAVHFIYINSGVSCVCGLLMEWNPLICDPFTSWAVCLCIFLHFFCSFYYSPTNAAHIILEPLLYWITLNITCVPLFLHNIALEKNQKPTRFLNKNTNTYTHLS